MGVVSIIRAAQARPFYPFSNPDPRSATDTAIMSVQQKLLEQAVNHHFPSAFVSIQERVAEFEIGKVLVLHKKRHWWRRHPSLDFTSLPLKTVLTSQLHVTRQALLDITAGTQSEHSAVAVTLGVKGGLKKDLLAVVGQGKSKHISDLTFLIDFGKVEHVVGDIFTRLYSSQYIIDTMHPVVQDALERGKEMYVITSVYKASKVDIKVLLGCFPASNFVNLILD